MSIDTAITIVILGLGFIFCCRLSFKAGRTIGRCEGVNVTMHVAKKIMKEEIAKVLKVSA